MLFLKDFHFQVYLLSLVLTLTLIVRAFDSCVLIVEFDCERLSFRGAHCDVLGYLLDFFPLIVLSGWCEFPI